MIKKLQHIKHHCGYTFAVLTFPNGDTRFLNYESLTTKCPKCKGIVYAHELICDSSSTS